MAKNEKSQAELYREQRKARLAKASKKNAKKSISSDASKVAGRVVTVILVLAILVGIGSVVFKQAGVVEKSRSAFVVADQKVSQAEYGYYYMSAYNQISSYAQYGYDIGLDTSKSPAEQQYNGMMGEIEDFPKDKTPMWSDYFAHSAEENIKYIKASCKEAAKLKVELTDADKAEVEKTMKQYKEYAQSAGGDNATYSVSAWLKQNFGNGMTEKLLKKILEEQQLAKALQDSKVEEFENALSKKEINTEYSKNTQNYAVVTFRSYTVSAEKVASKNENGEDTSAVTKATMKAAKAAADKIAAASSEEQFKSLAADAAKAAGNKDYKTFLTEESATLAKDVNYDTTSQNVSDEDFLEWAFDKSTAIGSTYIVENENAGYSVYMMVNPLHKAETYKTYDSRHILINFKEEAKTEDTAKTEDKKDDSKEETTTAPVKEEVKIEPLDLSKYSDVKVDLQVTADKAKNKAAYKEAQDVLEKYLSGEHTEEAFAALAEEYSADTGSNENGGLYEGTKAGTFVPPYDKFCTADGRKAGDIALVEYENAQNYSGYHIIYFIGKDTVKWDDAVKTHLASEKFNEYIEKIVHSDDLKVESKNDKALGSVEKFLVDAIKTAARNSQQQNQYAAY